MLDPAQGFADAAAEMPPVPAATSQTCALLLTDLVDSTLLVERLGDAAAAEVGAAHDRVARDLLRRHRGREIDKTDGMLLLFDRAADAVDYALAYHAALAALAVPLQARAGLHVGAVLLRANPAHDVALGAKPIEVEGLAKPLAARVMSLARAGQTLLTAEARAALGATRLRLQSHGHWRIKGLAEPVELFEVGDERTHFAPPPDAAKVYRVVRRDGSWGPLRELPNNLPAERDAFVGRGNALGELARRFDAGARLVSLLGIGGTGKTRLAMHFARTWLGDFPGGTWFCDLSTARDADGIVQAVAQALEVPLGRDDPVQQLGHAIDARGACLLILDNFEQVSRHAEATLGRWLDRAAQARFLVTTREVLGVAGEEALPLPPLRLDEAQALFECRAAAATGGRPAAAEDAAAIPLLVQLLDGLPLAIELAAARARALPPRLLLARMDQRFRLLTARGGRHDRQATLRATFDWSWDLLDDAERTMLAQLSVFEGGFTLEAAEAVVALPARAATVPDLLQSLVDKSFVLVADDARYDLLVSVRDYAAERLVGLPLPDPAAEPWATRTALAHGRYYARLPADGSASAPAEIGNLTAACRGAIALGVADLAAALLERSWGVLQSRGPFRLGAELAAQVRTLSDAPGLAARMALVAGSAELAAGARHPARAFLEEAARAAQEAGLDATLAHAEGLLGSLLSEEGAVEDAQARLQAALALAGTVGDADLLCRIRNQIGTHLIGHGAVADAVAHFEQALDAARRGAPPRWVGGFLGNLGYLAEEQGRSADAARCYAQALSIARQIGDQKFAGNTLSNIGLLAHFEGRADDARRCFDEALAIARSIGHRNLEAVVQCNLGLHHEAEGRDDAAIGGFEQALAIASELQDRRLEAQVRGYLGRVHAHRGDPALARDHLASSEGQLRELSDPVSLAVVLCARGALERMSGDGRAAAACLAEAEALALSVGAGARSELGLALAALRRLEPAPDQDARQPATG